jgi:PAS domain S-box-containing protein
MKNENNPLVNYIESSCHAQDEDKGAAEAMSRERDQLRVHLNICQMAVTQSREIISFVIEECIKISGSELGFFGFVSKDETIMTAYSWLQKGMESSAIDKRPVEFPCSDGEIWTEAVKQRKAVIFNDYRKADSCKKSCSEGHVTLSRVMSIPIIDAGKAVAVAVVANKKEDYTESDYLHIHFFLENTKSIIQRQQSIEALQISEEWFLTVADFTYTWEIWRGTDGRYIYISPACERTTGYSVEEFMNDPGLVIKIAHPDDRMLLVKNEDECLTGQFFDFDFRIITRGGEERWINHVCQPVFSNDAKPLAYRAINRDITLKKKLEIEKDAYNRQLKKLVETKTAELEELNTALKVMLRHSEAEKTEIEQRILANMNEFVTPYLEKLKASQLSITQKTLIDILESNLKDIFSSFLRHMSMTQYNLTPKEIQIATMIQSGRTSKEMASILNVSNRTINFHRENVRKKLGLRNKKVNLRSHLLLIT